MEYRYKLRMLGIEINTPTVLLIDNQSVIANTTLPSSTIKKKHNSIAYHRMREAVAAGIIKVGYIHTKSNLADILTKPIGPADYWRLLTEPLYGRDRAIKGELTGFTSTRDQGPKAGLPEGAGSNDNGNQATYRYCVTLYIESQVTPDSAKDYDSDDDSDRSTDEGTGETKGGRKMFRTIHGETPRRDLNRIEPYAGKAESIPSDSHGRESNTQE
jgi:hypothetical protein